MTYALTHFGDVVRYSGEHLVIVAVSLSIASLASDIACSEAWGSAISTKRSPRCRKCSRSVN